MPVRDGARFLDAGIISILEQRAADFEFLIIDDGSTDKTPELLTRWAAADARIRVISTSPAGIVAALNLGIAQAAAPWIARMDADDLADPNRLRQQLVYAACHPHLAAIGTGWTVIDAAGRRLRTETPPGTPEEIAATLPHRNCLAHPTMMLRTEAVRAAGGYRPAFVGAEDYDLWLRLAESHPLGALPAPLLFYREHAAQTAWREIEQRLRAELAARAAARCRRNGLPDPTAHAAMIDLRVLAALGIEATDYQDLLIERCLNLGVDAVRAGQLSAARSALRLLLAQPRARLRTRCHALLLMGRSLWARTTCMSS